jgi:hypothetical protein
MIQVGCGWAVVVGWPKGIATFVLFELIFNRTDLILSKDGLPELENFQTKYGIVENETRNHFPYCNFSKFSLEFELKIREGSRC